MTEIAQIAQVNLGGGNTIIPPKKSRKWILVINNYTKKNYLELLKYFESYAKLYILAKEIGENKTPHIQAYCNLKIQRTFLTMKKDFPTAHIEQAKGSDKQNFIYCAKDGDFKTNMKFKIPRKVIDPLYGKTFYDYQKEVIDLIQKGDDDRTINWYWEPTGNTGKSALCKHLCMRFNCMILNGKQSDMFHAILQYNENTGDFPEVIIIDIPRSMSDYVSWGAIEKIKDGCFYSGKYEGGMCIFNSPIIICFANVDPVTNKMSEDRWNIKLITGIGSSITEVQLSSSEELPS